MKLVKTFAAIGLLAGACTAQAAVTLNFDSLSDASPVGSSYFPAYGISFGANALAVGSQAADPNNSGAFQNQPSGTMAVLLFDESLPASTSFTVNVQSGFDGGFGTAYTNISRNNASAALISIYDALDGQGNLLGTVELGYRNQDGCNSSFACNWGLDFGTTFNGRAYSIVVSGANGGLFLDDMRFGVQDPPDGRVPEPASLALALAGFGAALLGGRRRKTQAG